MSLRIVGVSLVLALAVACGGEDGEDGEDGISWLTAAVPASTNDCANGGTSVQVGPDTNRNGTLDAAEVTSTSHVCNGTDGDPSDLWLVATEEADTDRCAWGGTIVHTGKDTNGSEVLDAAEFLSTQPVCKSAVTASGSFAVWTGNGDDNKFSNPDNWQFRTVPLEGQSLRFPDEGVQKTVENDLPLLTVFGGLAIDGGYQFSGKKLVVLASILVVDPIAGTPVTMAWPMVMHGGGISVDPDGAPGDELIISGAIEGVGRLVKENTGTLRLSGANTFRGGIDIAEGTLMAVGGSALPDFGDVACLGAGTLHVDAAGDSVPSLRGACAVILDGPLVLTDVDDDSYSGAMSGPGVLTKRGGGFLALTGDGGTHSGALLVQEGSVFINSDYGATAVTVSSSATLAGNGNPGAITVASGGTVAPGGAGPAILTSSSNVALAAGSTLAVKLNGTVSGTGYDRLAANGDIALGGSTLAVDMGFTASEGNAFTIVQCTGALTGTFAGIADQGAVIFESQRFIVDYTANAVILTRDDP